MCWFSPLGREDSLKKEMATHSNVLAWGIPWTEEPGGYSPWGHRELDTAKHAHMLLVWIPTSSICYLTVYFKIRELVGMGRGEERLRCAERVKWKLILLYVK